MEYWQRWGPDFVNIWKRSAEKEITDARIRSVG